MPNKFFDVIDTHDFVSVSPSRTPIFEGIYVHVIESRVDGVEYECSVRLSRPDARALARKILELLED
jgi:hypothetical protein